MKSFVYSQVLAGIAFAFGIASFQFKPRRKLLLCLYDATGKARAILSTDKDLSTLILVNPTGQGDVLLSTKKSGPTLTLSDSTGKNRVLLGTDKEGPELVLSDATGQGRASLGTGAAETPDGKTITYPESTLMLFGPDGTVLWQAPRRRLP